MAKTEGNNRPFSDEWNLKEIIRAAEGYLGTKPYSSDNQSPQQEVSEGDLTLVSLRKKIITIGEIIRKNGISGKFGAEKCLNIGEFQGSVSLSLFPKNHIKKIQISRRNHFQPEAHISRKIDSSANIVLLVNENRILMRICNGCFPESAEFKNPLGNIISPDSFSKNGQLTRLECNLSRLQGNDDFLPLLGKITEQALTEFQK